MRDALYMIAEPNTSGILNSLLTALKLWQLPHVQLTSGLICHSYCHHLLQFCIIIFCMALGSNPGPQAYLVRLFVCLFVFFHEKRISPMQPLRPFLSFPALASRCWDARYGGMPPLLLPLEKLVYLSNHREIPM